MGASMLASAAFASQAFSFRWRNGGELGNRGNLPLQFRGRDSSSFSRCSISVSRSLGRDGSNDGRYVVQGLWRVGGLWSRTNQVRRATSQGRRATSGRGGGGNRGWENRNRILMRSGGDKNENSSDDDQVETLFMRELRRRGMSSKEQDGDSVGSAGTDTKTKEDSTQARGPFGGGWSRASKTKPPPQLTESQKDEQLKRSMALNSEGLDGLIPRATELVKLGGTFFLAFWPFILAILVAFLAVYLYFGSAFIHTGNSFEGGRPTYVEPSKLLEEKVPSQIGPNRVPYKSRSSSDSP